ncbi:MAG TPA: VOC family protein [Nitrospiria bacterium]|nr:VOC family protein [Nitrospiria bacterium]
MASLITDSWVMAGVKNVKKSIAFYSKFGLKPSMASDFYAEFNLPGGTVFGLHTVEAPKGVAKKKLSDGGWGIMIRVNDLKKMTAKLKAGKIKHSKIRSAPGGADFSSVNDLDGNRLILVEMQES